MLSADESRFVLSVQGVEATWQIVRFEAEEGLSTLYSVSIEALSDDLTPGDVVGRDAVLTVRGEGEPRHLHGIVADLAEGSRGLRERAYELVIVPRVWRLTQRHDCRIFQEKTVLEIARAVLRDAGVPGDALELRIGAPHPPRDYCVQYRESDWAFLARLMEEEGIFYFFEHREDGHTLVLADQRQAHAPVEGAPEVPFHPADGAVEVEEFIARFRYRERIGTGAVALRDWDFTRPALDLTAAARSDANAELERYDYPGEYVAAGEGRALARVRAEELRWPQRTAEGSSNCARLAPGRRFTLDDPLGALRADLLGEYTVTHVAHRGVQRAAARDGAPAVEEEYENTFRCIAAAVTWRPPRTTPRPVVQGVQTAIVVGPAGEEIYTDPHGRVKVQFHWDRLGRRDERSSCWVRVSQAWAGQGYGFMAIPRVGHEVIVSFLEGDPDRPIITGRVYHGVNTPPYDLPGAMTRTTLMSNSSPGGGGSNELRFEDAAGAEEVYLHGQKDWNIDIEHDKGQHVGHDESLRVDHDRSISVGHDQTESVEHDRVEDVGHDHTETIGANMTVHIVADHTESVGGSRVEDVTGDASLHVGGSSDTSVDGSLSLTVMRAKTEQVLLASNETVGAVKAVEVGAAYSIAVVAGMSTRVGASLSQQAGGNVSSSSGGNTSLTAGGNLSTHSDKDTSIDAGKGVTVHAGKDVTVSADKKATFRAVDQVTVVCGDAKIVMKKNGDIVVSGKKITVKGSGDVKIKGSKVGVN